MRVHTLASQPHYAEHVGAIHRHLPPGLKGQQFFGSRPKGWDADDVVMIGGFYDLDRVPHHRAIYVEHGAGQRYGGDPRSCRHPAYHGNPHHPQRVIGYICPRLEVAAAWGRPAFAAGSPVCDGYPLTTFNPQPIVVITFHWDAYRVCPEASSALEHYVQVLPDVIAEMRAQGLQVYGHYHPRDRRLPLVWGRLGVEIRDVDFVRRHADLLLCDNSSLMYEMCHLNRRVVALNCPQYRRDVQHGLRFWDWAGPQIDEPYELLGWDWVSFIHHQQPHPETRNGALAYDSMLATGIAGARAARWVTNLLAEQ